MPNRIIKESICTSDSVDQLSWFEEVLFYRLIVNCDDFGRFDGRTAVVKNRLFPLKENLTLKNVDSAIKKLARIGLVTLYESDGKPFLFLPTWNEHQNVRAKRSRYPEPEIICMQMNSDDCKCPRNPIQSESNPNPNPNPTAAQPPKEVRHKYGQYQNVLLTDADMEKLKQEFPDWQERIERLSEYIASHGKRYENHLATIRSWARKDQKQTAVQNNRDLSSDELEAIQRMLKEDGV